MKTEEGEVWAWGNNYSGQLGTGDTQDRNTPVKIESSIRFTQIHANRDSSYGIDSVFYGRIVLWILTLPFSTRSRPSLGMG